MRAARLPLLFLLLSFLSPALAQQAPQKNRLELRLVSFNVWGLKWVSADREARLKAIGPALVALKPDVVMLQEVWVAADAERVLADLAAAGLTHAAHYDGGLLGSGMIVASVYPILRSRHDPFELAGKAHKPYHGDWYARKGVTQATLDTPVGQVTVATTHLHAGYGSDEYALVQIAQALQAADFLGDHGLRPPDQGDAATPPLILGGDVNSRRGSLPFRLLTARAGLTPVEAELGIDWFFHRSGGAIEVRQKSVKQVLTEEVELKGAGTRTLSDHPAVLAVLQLRRRQGQPRVARQPAADWRAAAAEALPLIEAEIEASRERAGQARASGVFLLLISLGFFALLWKVKGRSRWLLALAAMALLHLATWRVYLGFIYEPTLRQGLANAQQRLQE